MKYKEDFDKVSGTWLQLDTYEDDVCIVIQFQVPTDWLKGHVEENYRSLENFLNVYTSDESVDIYKMAQDDEVVLCEIKR